VSNFDPKELALQIVDIITLRQEIQLCYVGISKKCFEILETRRSEGTSRDSGNTGINGVSIMVETADSSDEHDTEEEMTSEPDDTSDDDDDTPVSVADVNETESEASDADSDADSFREPDHIQERTRLRLREILFYDDKVEIFKARHGRL
jgi:hypothetical protein